MAYLRYSDKLQNIWKVDPINFVFYIFKMDETNKHVFHKNLVVGSSIIGFPLLRAVSEQDMPGIKPGLLGWHTSTLTNELQEERKDKTLKSCGNSP
jgi:hypothetical protein